MAWHIKGYQGPWCLDSALRRRCQAGLNKGEAAHKLKRAVCCHERSAVLLSLVEAED